MPYSDSDVVCPITQRDGHPDLCAEREVLEHITASDPDSVLALIAELKRLEQEIVEVRNALNCALVDCPMRRD